jgi:hypothetical protein
MIGKFAVTLFRRLLMLLEDGEQVDTALVNDYGTKYVVFLDLLGFSELVKRSGADVVERHRLVESLKLVRDTLCEDPASTFGLLISLIASCSPQTIAPMLFGKSFNLWRF